MDRFDPLLHSSLEEAGTLLGQLFQRSDDLLDFDIRNNEGKAILGDLKSGYMNSFATFATTHLSVEARSRLRSCESLMSFQQAIGGEDVFRQKWAEFDKKNKFLIQLYQHHLKNLSLALGESEKVLIAKLEPLSDLLYWRKQGP